MRGKSQLSSKDLSTLCSSSGMPPWTMKNLRFPRLLPVSEPGFWDLLVFKLSILDLLCFCKICLRKVLVRYRGIDNKGVLERPWTKWKLLRAISSTLTCPLTGKCWKVDFPMPCHVESRSCQSSTECLRMVCALPPDTPRPPQFQPELWKNKFVWKTRFFQVH